MKMKNIIYLLSALALFSCEPEMESFEPSAGNADFSKMVAVGSSLTAGFADGELYRSAQLNSFPNIIAQQMQHVGGGDFNQPLMKNDYGFGSRLVLGVVNGSLAPVPFGDDDIIENFELIYDDEGPFCNFGVPGAKADHLIADGYGALNPYFGRFAENIFTSSVLGDAMEVDPTFFLLWIGNNDVLSFAASGGEGETITNFEYYSTIMSMIIDQLTSNNAKGAIANIPDVTLTPFFNTIPSNGLLLTAVQAAGLNAAYADLPHIEFYEGKNGFVVIDPEAAGHIRQLKESELLLLTTPQDSLAIAGWGSQTPIPQEYYLSEDQIDEIKSSITQYNSFIETIAGENNLAYVDVNTILKEAVTGIWFDGVNFSTRFVSGGVFSLDGIHLSARGNAIAANTFIDAINNKYGSSIPKVSVTEYPGIVFP